MKKKVLIAVAVVLVIGGIATGAGDEDGPPTPAPVESAAVEAVEAEQQPPSAATVVPTEDVSEQPIVNEPEVASTEAELPTATDAIGLPTTPELDGCTVAPPELVAQVEAGMVDDLRLALAYVADDGGRQVLGASIFDATGERVSSADTWLIENGVVYALSGSANEYTEWPDGRDLPDNPSAGIGVPLDLQEQCTIPAITGR